MGPRRSLGQLQSPVVVTVPVVRVVKVSIHQIVDVIAVGNGGVPAVGTVNVTRVVALAVVSGTACGIGVRDLYDVLVVVAFMGAVKVPVMEVADVVTVLNSDMAAVRAMLMGMVLVGFVVHGFVS